MNLKSIVVEYYHDNIYHEICTSIRNALKCFQGTCSRCLSALPRIDESLCPKLAKTANKYFQSTRVAGCV